MSRNRIIKKNDYPFHIISKSPDLKDPDLDSSELWRFYTNELCLLTWAYGIQVHAFVLMEDHYHLLMSAPETNLDEAAGFFEAKLGHRVDIGFASSTKIHDSSQYLEVLKFVYQKPLSAQRAREVSDYPFSTLHGILGYSKLEIPVQPHHFQSDSGLNFTDLVCLEKWVNTIHSEDFEFQLAKG